MTKYANRVMSDKDRLGAERFDADRKHIFVKYSERIPRFKDVKPDRIDQFFLAIGRQMFTSLFVCTQLGHAHPHNTIRDYYRANGSGSEIDDLASEFLIDFMHDYERSAGIEILAKWLGIFDGKGRAMGAFNKSMVSKSSKVSESATAPEASSKKSGKEKIK